MLDSEEAPALAALRTKRDAVLELLELQAKLHSAAYERREREHHTITQIAEIAGANWPEVSRFMERKNAAMGGKLLQGIASYVGDNAIASDIKTRCAALGNKSTYIGLSLLDTERVRFVFDVLEAYEMDKGDMTLEEFSRAFDQPDAVIGVLHLKRDIIGHLLQEDVSRLQAHLASDAYAKRLSTLREELQAESNELRGLIKKFVEDMRSKGMSVAEVAKTANLGTQSGVHDVLSGRARRNTLRRIAGCVQGFLKTSSRRSEEREDLVERLEELIASALSRYGSQKKAAKALGISRRVFQKSYTSSLPVERLRERIRSMRERLASDDAATSRDVMNTMPCPSQQAMNESSVVNEGEPDEVALRALLGVLRPETYRQIDYNPGQKGIDFLRTQIAVVRAILNAFMCITDDNLRRVIQQSLSEEVQDLHAATELFSFEFPNRVIARVTAARDAADKLPFNTGSKKSSRRKR